MGWGLGLGVLGFGVMGIWGGFGLRVEGFEAVRACEIRETTMSKGASMGAYVMMVSFWVLWLSG